MPAGEDTLYTPRPGDSATRGHYPGHVMQSSAYTTLRLNRGKTLMALAALGIGVALATNSFDPRRPNGRD